MPIEVDGPGFIPGFTEQHGSRMHVLDFDVDGMVDIFIPYKNRFLAMNRVGGRHGIGRLDIVENRYVGIKSRGCYETPGGTIMLKAHRAIESLTLDREVAHLKDELMPRYAELVYNGFWFAPERRMLPKVKRFREWLLAEMEQAKRRAQAPHQSAEGTGPTR